MAAEAAGNAGGAPACLCVLCGLPAAGKSSLAVRILGAAARRGWRAAVVPYDDLIPERAFRAVVVVEDSVGLEETHTEWKLHRQAVLQCIDQFLSRPGAMAEPQSSSRINGVAWAQCLRALLQNHSSKAERAPLLLLLDDNFYYPSMRYEVCQLARKHSLGFCQVHLRCDLDSCIGRNQSRSRPVPAEVISEMAKRLEPPDPQKNSWEKRSISLNTTENLSEWDIEQVVELMSAALSDPLSPAEDNTEQKEADRLKCANSVVHQADQACRRLISEAMKTARDDQLSSDQMRTLAAQLNQTKASFLRKLREQILQEVPFMQDEDVDVERVVKRAVATFDDNKKEILLKITS